MAVRLDKAINAEEPPQPSVKTANSHTDGWDGRMRPLTLALTLRLCQIASSEGSRGSGTATPPHTHREPLMVKLMVKL